MKYYRNVVLRMQVILQSQLCDNFEVLLHAENLLYLESNVFKNCNGASWTSYDVSNLNLKLIVKCFRDLESV